MNAKEAGAKGGKAVVEKYGKAHMVAIGKVGGLRTPTKLVAGDTRTMVLASRGGKASGGNFAFDRARAVAAGKKGAAARWAKRRAKLAEEKDAV